MRRPSFAVLVALAVVAVVVSWNVLLRRAEKQRPTAAASALDRRAPSTAGPGAVTGTAARPRPPAPARSPLTVRGRRSVAVRQVVDTAFAVRGGALVAAVDGEAQRAPVMAVLPFPLTVEVTDSSGRPIPGVPVHWTVSSGGGRLTADTSATDRAGRMTVRWVLSYAPGVHTVRASVPGAPGAAVFTAVATSELYDRSYAWR
jgi:hypothetical protein